MNAWNMEIFDIIDYCRRLQQSLKRTSGYEFCRVSDAKAMEEVLQNSKRCNRFFAVDDSQEGITFCGDGGGWFERRPVTIFLLGKVAKWPDMNEREKVLNEMRYIYRQLLSRLLHDQAEFEPLTYLNEGDISFDEIPGEFAGGTAGLFFTFTVDIPVNLEYDESEWE